MATNNAINTDTNSFCKTANDLSDVATPATARLNLFVPLSVATATVLPATAYGKEVICTGSSGYALTLPTVTSNANKFIDIFSQTTSNALVTITPASGTIAGQATLVIGTGDGVRIMNDGTNWWVLSCWLQPVSFSATLSASQSIPNTTQTKILYDGTNFNVGGFFDTATNHRFTPLLPGKYYINQSINLDTSATAAYALYNFIHRNGGDLHNIIVTTAAANQIFQLSNSTYTQLNGVTDYIEGFIQQTSGGAVNLLQTTNLGNVTGMIGYRVSLF